VHVLEGDHWLSLFDGDELRQRSRPLDGRDVAVDRLIRQLGELADALERDGAAESASPM